MNTFAYLNRWITARKLSHLRKIDPDKIASYERIAALGGFNMQLDEVRK